MRIDLMKPDHKRYCERRDELNRFAGDLDAPFARPCANCNMPCPCCGSPTCTCACGPSCAHAPAELSCDPGGHPIEPAIVPLVYAVATLRSVVPCWSCEGHKKKTGGLLRPPQVWFHAQSLAHVAVIDEFIQDLSVKSKLTHHWRVRSITMGNRLDSTFALEPDLHDWDDVSLLRLRRDADIIAEELTKGVRDLIDRFRTELDTALAL